MESGVFKQYMYEQTASQLSLVFLCPSGFLAKFTTSLFNLARLPGPDHMMKVMLT